MVAGPPEMCQASLAARHCWVWCDGWKPDLWPAYATFHDIDDWQMLIELMQVIREHV